MSGVAEQDQWISAARAKGLGHLVDAHGHSDNHRAELEASSLAGCFHCLATYPPDAIAEWIWEDRTAICPKCGIDSVIGTASGFPADNKDFLQQMRALWFASAEVR